MVEVGGYRRRKCLVAFPVRLVRSMKNGWMGVSVERVAGRQVVCGVLRLLSLSLSLSLLADCVESAGDDITAADTGCGMAFTVTSLSSTLTAASAVGTWMTEVGGVGGEAGLGR